MSDNGQNTQGPAELFTQMWADFAGRMAKAGAAFDTSKPPGDAARAMRDATIQALNQHAQDYLRSPQYLAMLKQAMDASIQTRRQLNDFLAQAQHEFQAASRQDADHLMQAITSLETRIASGMDRLGDHIDRINARLDALEGDQSSHATAPVPAKKRPVKHAAKPAGQSAGKRRRAKR